MNIDTITSWLQEESDPLKLAVLATVDEKGIPHSRVVAVKEINECTLTFFTQKGSTKVKQITHNNRVSITLILFEKRRQITLEGIAMPLSEQENQSYWETYSKESQIRFTVYGSNSGNQVTDPSRLNDQLKEAQKKYQDHAPEKPEAYVGYKIEPSTIKLYQLNDDTISDSYIGQKLESNWTFKKVVP